LFDERIVSRPLSRVPDQDDRWGGYDVEFKVIEDEKARLIGEDLSKARRLSLVIGPSQKRILKVQISKFEFCKGKQETELDDYKVYVYTPPMIAIEKFRAICQQMTEYKHRRSATARARDFYDIYSIIKERRVNLKKDENVEMFRNIFAGSIALRIYGTSQSGATFSFLP